MLWNLCGRRGFSDILMIDIFWWLILIVYFFGLLLLDFLDVELIIFVFVE